MKTVLDDMVEILEYSALILAGVVSLYVIAKSLLWVFRKFFGEDGNESTYLKEIYGLIVPLAAIGTLSLGWQAYDGFRQSIVLNMTVEQVDSTKNYNKKGLVITLEIENKGIDHAIVTTHHNDELLTVSKVAYEDYDPTNLYSIESFKPYYFYSLTTMEDGKVTSVGEPVYERMIARGEKKRLVFYIEVDKGYTYHISSKLKDKNLFFSRTEDANGDDRNESEYKFFESDYIHVGRDK